jgi:hypothetical protein
MSGDDESGEPVDQAAAGGRPVLTALARRSSRAARGAAAPMIVVVLVAVVFGALKISGSSTGLFDEFAADPSTPDGILKQVPRPVRSDEWLVRTPWVLRQAATGFDGTVRGGVGRHDVGVLADLPVWNPLALLRPHQLAYFALPIDVAFALEWWLLHVVQFAGMYLLLVVTIRRPWISAACAALITLSPASQWWTGSATFLAPGYAALAAALVVIATREERRWARIALAAAAGWAGAAFAVVLYPPWQIPSALIVVTFTVAVIARDLGGRPERTQLLRLLAVVVGALTIAASCSAAFAVGHRDAIGAIGSTVYPGDRAAERGGSVPPEQLLGGSLDSFAASKRSTDVNGRNQSENAVGVLLVIPVALATLAALAAMHLRRRDHWPLIGMLGVGTVFGAWMLLDLPSWIGAPLLLDRVPPARLLLPITVVGALSLGLFIASPSAGERRLRPAASIVIGTAFAGMQYWVVGSYVVGGESISGRSAGLLIALFSVGSALAISHLPAVGLSMLVALTAWQAVLINPLQIAVPELRDGRVRAVVDRVDESSPDGTAWLSFAPDPLLRAVLTASGVDTLAAVSPYPDRDAWTVLDDDGQHEEVWNRYAYVYFTPLDPGFEPTFTLDQTDRIFVGVDPCDVRLDGLFVGIVVSDVELDRTCLSPVASVEAGASTFVFYARTVAGGPDDRDGPTDRVGGA